jgi:hypothetical protein
MDVMAVSTRMTEAFDSVSWKYVSRLVANELSVQPDGSADVSSRMAFLR